MGRKKSDYKVRISNHLATWGQEQTLLSFGEAVDIADRLGCKYMTLEVRGSRLVFVPDGDVNTKKNFAAAKRISIKQQEVTGVLAQFNGEYDRITKQEDGSVSVDIADRRPIKIQHRKQGATAAKVTPTVNSRAAISAISQEAREKIKRLDEDIEEAKKMLQELLDERKKEEFILENAGNLLSLLGG